MKFFLLINVKMPTTVGILTFMSGKNSIIGLSEPKKCRISWYFYTYEHLKFHAQLTWAWKKFYNLGARSSHRLHKPIWKDNKVPLRSKVKRRHSLVIFLHSVCLWIQEETGRQVFELRCYQSYRTFLTSTMSPMKRCAKRYKQPLKHMMNSWPCYKNRRLSIW